MGWEITEEFVNEWERIRSKVDGASGHGVANSPTSISQSAGNVSVDGLPKQQWKRVKIIDNLGGDSTHPSGRYTGKIFFGAINNDASILQESDLGTLDSRTVELWSLTEIYASGTSPTYPTFKAGDFVLALFSGFNKTSGNPIFLTDVWRLPNWWPEVDLVSDGGANATPVYEGWTPATYTYSVYISTYSGDSTKLLLTSATPRRGRPAGWLTGPASRGTVCLLPDGTLALASADEQLNIFSPCAESDGD